MRLERPGIEPGAVQSIRLTVDDIEAPQHASFTRSRSHVKAYRQMRPFTDQYGNLGESRYEGVLLKVTRDVPHGVYWLVSTGLTRTAGNQRNTSRSRRHTTENNYTYFHPAFFVLNGEAGYPVTKNLSLVLTLRNMTRVYDDARSPDAAGHRTRLKDPLLRIAPVFCPYSFGQQYEAQIYADAACERWNGVGNVLFLSTNVAINEMFALAPTLMLACTATAGLVPAIRAARMHPIIDARFARVTEG